MKKHLLIFITLLYYQISFSQNDNVSISGKVTAENSSRKEEAIKNALIHLKLSNGGMFEAKSNDTGHYFFIVKPFQGVGELTIATDKNTSFINSKSYGFLASSERDTLNFNYSKKHIKDFKVKRIIPCGLEIPYIYFKYNSTEPYKFYTNDSLNNPSSNEVVDIYYSVLIEDPTITILIEGHCDSREQDADTLSLTRANYMRKALINKGIDKERIITKGWGSKKPIVKNEVINNAATTQEKENLYLKNRRISYRVANWDYIPKENNKNEK